MDACSTMVEEIIGFLENGTTIINSEKKNSHWISIVENYGVARKWKVRIHKTLKADEGDQIWHGYLKNDTKEFDL